MMKKKLMLAAVSTGLVAAVGVGGTLAYLSAQSEQVTNTFAVGEGYIEEEGGDAKGIWLDETLVDSETGEPVVPAQRTLENEYNDLLPADTRMKDPTVSMIGGSVDSYVFVKVDGVDELNEKGVSVQDFNGDDWQLVAPEGEGTMDGIYIYKGDDLSYADAQGNKVVKVSDQEKGTKITLSTVFESIYVDSNITQDGLEALQGNLNDIVLQAVAVQADNNTADNALEQAEAILNGEQ
ncbi:MAG: SipW-dependent-type signal peptide-containing protein [Candidatus Ruminococcus intestinipullorum]|nr:SipW-dependent-type signal peptide-containing protein [Candidatus Ruminococcus intestinipullorum]